MDSSTAQVKVIFTTNEADLELPDSKRQLLVPADIKRYGLSRILNSESMLGTSSPIPLDFLANGTFLTTSIEEYLSSEGLSSESTLTLQYVRSLLPPSYEASFEHDDWAVSPTAAAPSESASRALPTMD
ncbi:Ribosome biogenesis protein YTM1 [Beauveria bassiana D1-5]|uniref:Ribosome biogenesis protein YTM1 n=1 Tax=Beauveria bassiana D1-5 TaxID=1245745 RepID=A0A0A2VM57_BEABA|nr:Ribosome biogenesis protein YTM1 [Beauveria bassiana D1-5]